MKKALSDKDVLTLATFLTDENERTVALAKQQLTAALRRNPLCERTLSTIKEPVLKRTVVTFLEDLRMEEIETAFRSLAETGENVDLEQGCFLLARVAYPNLTPADISRPLNQMAEEIQTMLSRASLDPLQTVHLMRRYLFERKGFRGNTRNYYDPDNSYINKVLERRQGIPISLSCVYLFVAWRLEMPAFGIGLPGHFIVGHRTPAGVIYVDPFHGGRVLSVNDCENLVRGHGISFQEEFLEMTPRRQILARVILNLINVYTEQTASARINWLTRLFELLHDPS